MKFISRPQVKRDSSPKTAAISIRKALYSHLFNGPPKGSHLKSCPLVPANSTTLWRGRLEDSGQWFHSWDPQWTVASPRLGLSGGALSEPWVPCLLIWYFLSYWYCSLYAKLVFASILTCSTKYVRYQVGILENLRRSEKHFTYVVHTIILCQSHVFCSVMVWNCCDIIFYRSSTYIQYLR